MIRFAARSTVTSSPACAAPLRSSTAAWARTWERVAGEAWIGEELARSMHSGMRHVCTPCTRKAPTSQAGGHGLAPGPARRRRAVHCRLVFRLAPPLCLVLAQGQVGFMHLAAVADVGGAADERVQRKDPACSPGMRAKKRIQPVCNFALRAAGGPEPHCLACCNTSAGPYLPRCRQPAS